MSTLIEAQPDRVSHRPRQLAGPVLGFILTMFLAASSAPTPLYRLYQERWGFSPTLLTVIFSVYAFSLLISLLVVGALSDHVGRRPVIFGALLLELVAMALFIRADSVPLLIAARAVQGLATGAATSALGAALIDASRANGALINSLAPLVGMALGGLGAGVLATFAPAPLTLVYVACFAIFATQAALIWAIPETAGQRPGVLASLIPKLKVPPAARGALARLTPLSVALWAVGGFSLSLLPSLVRTATGITSPLLGGVLVAILTLTGAAAILVLRQRPVALALNVGSGALAIGFAIILCGVQWGAAGLMITGMAVTGAGFGAGFLGAVRTLMPLAHPDERGALLSAYYVECYLAFSLPAIGAGFLARDLGITLATDIYGAVVIGLAVVGALVRPR